MDLSLTEEQEMLRTSIRSLCEDHFTTQSVRECEANPQVAATFKSKLAEMGVGGLLIPEDLGGLALGMTETVVVQSEIGRALGPSDLAEAYVLASSVFGDSALAKKSSEALAEIIGGEASIACAWHEDDRSNGFDGALAATCGADDVCTLNGYKSYVPYAMGLTKRLIVTARDADGAPILGMVDTDAAGVNATATANLADLPLARIEFANALGKVFARGEDAQRVWAFAFDRMLIAVAAQAVGGAERALEITVDYAKTREQFGQQIGSFQAIAHDLADAAVHVEGARFLTYRAAAAADDGDDFSTWAAMAKLKACKTFRDVSALCIQVHGGIGFTLAADPQLFYRRAKHLQLTYGDPMHLESRIGGAVVSGDHKVLQT